MANPEAEVIKVAASLEIRSAWEKNFAEAMTNLEGPELAAKTKRTGASVRSGTFA
jgi:hypothetical protein